MEDFISTMFHMQTLGIHVHPWFSFREARAREVAKIT